ncbi:MAG: phosphoenolpyruvate synthase, partial [Phaeodactylibacter sp.]|nr:phosphoenolpyruvate synthase [Phaeodactylibacter sp.]
MQKALFCLFFLLGTAPLLLAQKIENPQIKERIEKYKADSRGPYKDIRWFCEDGTFAQPKEQCAQPGGVQRARYKDEIVALGKSNHIFLGQILSTTPEKDFWDAANYNSRLKQYQLEKYLRRIDDGWILQKAQYYRGAYQIEDEEAWGIDFFSWLIQQDAVLEKQFFLLRQAIKDIPHRGEDNKTMNVRAVSKQIADAYPAFMDLRVKIHGQPEVSDIDKVIAFKAQHEGKLTAALLKNFDTLIADMQAVYAPVDLSELNRYLKNISKEAPIYTSLTNYINGYTKQEPARVMATAEMLEEIRQSVPTVKGKKARLALLDLSNALEEIFFVEAGKWEPATVGEATEKICYLGTATVGTGFVEDWEWDQVVNILAPLNEKEISLEQLTHYVDRAGSLIEWGTGMVNGVYKDVINLYNGFEPMSYGFLDDRIRGSVLLPLGTAVSDLSDFVARQSKLTNNVMNVSNQNGFRGLNPGYALGELVVVDDVEEIEVSKDKIYVFHNPPSDLKPVAGIMTVTEGNMVSHVQLLARNLAIPNAVLSLKNKEDLSRFAGEQVFFAVSNKGTVVMKAAAKMSAAEKALFAEKKRSEERITVPIEKMDLSQTGVLNLRTVNAASSGKLCGPKAANLGQLKAYFP